MRKLKEVGRGVPSAPSCDAGKGRAGDRPPYQFDRAAVVVPNGALLGDEVYAGMKGDLLEEFDLDGKNPAAREDIAHLPPQQLAQSHS